jgi:chromosomal replication initiation ATPase DnaA
VPAPTVVEICGVLQSVCRAEGISLPDQLASRVAQASGRNLRKAILMLEACKVSSSVYRSLQWFAVRCIARGVQPAVVQQFATLYNVVCREVCFSTRAHSRQAAVTLMLSHWVCLMSMQAIGHVLSGAVHDT